MFVVTTQPAYILEVRQFFPCTYLFTRIFATTASLPFMRMLRICKISGQELPAVSAEKIGDIRDLKQKLCILHGFPVCLQKLLHEGHSLDDSAKLETLQDTCIHLQLVLGTPSTAVELEETCQVFRVACRCGNLEAAQMLLQAGAQKDMRDEKLMTALMDAAFKGHTEIVQLLLQAGANKDLQDHFGWTALMEAARNGRMEIAQLLLQADADKDMQDRRGSTALMKTAFQGYTDIAQLLLQAGAEKDLQDHNENGTTALMEAARVSRTEIAQMLQQAGAN